jgi:hypothetical protein
MSPVAMVPLPALLSRGAGDMGAHNTMSERTRLFVIVFLALGVYNALEVLVKILRTFRAYRGVYFWSLVAASVGIVLHALVSNTPIRTPCGHH